MISIRAGLLSLFLLALYGVFLTGLVDVSRAPAPDFPNYYYAARSLADGESVYTPFTEKVIAEFGSQAEDVNYFADPPPVAILVFPFHYFSYQIAFWMLLAISTVAMFMAVWLTATELQLSRDWRMVLAIVSLLTAAYRYHALTNHLEAIIGLLCVLGWIRLRRSGSPGVYWGVAAAIKMFPALWTVAFIRDWRIVVAGFASFLAVFGFSTWVVGFDDLIVYVNDIIPLSKQWNSASGNYSLMALGTKLYGASLGWFLTGLGVFGFAHSVSKFHENPNALFVSGVAWSLLLSPLSWLNYLVIAFPPMIIAAQHMDWSTRKHFYPGIIMIFGLTSLRPHLILDNVSISMAFSSIPMISLVLLAVWAPTVMMSSALNPEASERVPIS